MPNHYHGQKSQSQTVHILKAIPTTAFSLPPARLVWNPQTVNCTSTPSKNRLTVTCRNIGIMLEAAGTSFDKVIKANCFIADMDDFDASIKCTPVLYLQACSYLVWP